MSDVSADLIEKAARAIYPDVMNTWEDTWPVWEYADESQAEFMRGLARAVLGALDLPGLLNTAKAEALREAADVLDDRAYGGTAYNAAADIVRRHIPKEARRG